MPRKHPMPPDEEAICRRLRRFRLWTDFSGAEFCALVGLNPVAYASYEYARSQFNYPAAWKIFKVFPLLNAVWLAEGEGEMLEVRMFAYPAPADTGFGPRAPFSRVYRMLLREPLLKAETAHLMEPLKRFSLFTVPPDVRGRLFGKEKLGDILSGWLATLPDTKVNDFLNEIFKRSAQVAARYPRDDDEAEIQRRLDQMYKIEEMRRFPSKNSFRKPLTDVAPEGNMSSVSEMQDMIARLRKVTLQRGKKAELARHLGVAKSRVSKWLRKGKAVMPSGQTTLRLLHWVEQQERQPNSPGSAMNTTKAQTQLRKCSYEKAKSGPRKH